MHAHMYVCVHFVYSMSDMLHIHTYIHTYNTIYEMPKNL